MFAARVPRLPRGCPLLRPECRIFRGTGAANKAWNRAGRGRTPRTGSLRAVTLDGLRLSLGLLTIVPVSARRLDRDVAGRAVTWAPAVGVLVGMAAAAVLLLGHRVLGLGSLVAAALSVGTVAVLTRGLHLDGLADLADGLGSGRPVDQALRVMRSPEIGPFGVIVLVLVLLVQVAALARTVDLGHGVMSVGTAAVTGRLAVTCACRTGVPPARADGLGALVAGTVRRPVLVALTVAVLVGGASAGALGGPVGSVVAVPMAIAAGLLVAVLVERHAVRRLGGVTGDVLGAQVEVAATAALVVMAVRPAW